MIEAEEIQGLTDCFQDRLADSAAWPRQKSSLHPQDWFPDKTGPSTRYYSRPTLLVTETSSAALPPDLPRNP
jgi:hypothetical protein